MLTVDFSHFPELRTERLHLREPALGDAPALFAMRSKPRMMAHIGKPLMKEEQEAIDLLTRISADRASNTGIAWAIQRKEEVGMIGMIGYHRLKLEHHTAEVGYMLSDAHWGQGLMTEALRAVLHAGSERFGFHRIEAITAPGNAASRQVLEKCGFAMEGILKESYHFNGAFEDSCIFGRVCTSA